MNKELIEYVRKAIETELYGTENSPCGHFSSEALAKASIKAIIEYGRSRSQALVNFSPEQQHKHSVDADLWRLALQADENKKKHEKQSKTLVVKE